jgi:tetratricopeptide (TPR) repeat protein
LATSIIQKDLLFYQPRNELYLINIALDKKDNANRALSDLDKTMQNKVQSYLEFATDYANCGFYDEAIDILTRLENKGEQFPMLYYYLGYFWSKMNDKEMANKYFEQASIKPHAYCFPFRDESLDVLSVALEHRPNDAMALYYLGNMFYELQPEIAISYWEKSRLLNGSFYITQRNLAWAASQQNDLNKALEFYKEAFTSNHEDTRLMFEYDNTCERAGITPLIRYETIYEGNRSIAKLQSSTYLRELGLMNFLGRYQEVIEILTNEDFIESEGSQILRDIFHNAHIFRSMQFAENDDFEAAKNDLKAAIDYPIGRWGSERRAQMNYLLGRYYEQSGSQDEAIACYEKAVSELVADSEFLYDKGLAYSKLGQSEKSREQFNALLEMANKKVDADAFRSFEAGSAGATQEARNAYLRGLAYKGLGRQKEAQSQFSKALQLNPAYIQANVMLNGGY